MHWSMLNDGVSSGGVPTESLALNFHKYAPTLTP